MTKQIRFWALALMTVCVVLTVESQPKRTDAIWARTVPAGTITLDGLLNEPAWAKAESLVVKWGQNNGDPGSGYRGEAGLNGGTTPTDPTNAVIKFLVSGDSLYVAVICKDSSIGGGLFNQFDGFLMNIRDRSKFSRPVPPYEYFYGWVTETWADTLTGLKGAKPGFFGWAGGSRDSIIKAQNHGDDGILARTVWDGATKVYGVTNSDTGATSSIKVADTMWVTEFKFNLARRGYDVTKVGGDIVQFSMSIYDSDWRWPLDTLKFTGNRTWVQCPWSNAAAYNHLRVFADPAVTTSTTTLPTVGYDLTIYNGSNLPAPTVDGNLTETVWKNAPGFDIRYGDNTLRNGYKYTMPYRSGQNQPAVYGQSATVLDPADATVKMFYNGDTLYVGATVRDQIVQAFPWDANRLDGFKIVLRDRAARDPAEHILLTRTLAVVVDTAAKGWKITTDSDSTLVANSTCALKLHSGTTVDTAGLTADSGFTVEMKINLRGIGYAAGRGDGVVFVGAEVYDGDTFNNLSPAYADQVWFGTDGGWNDFPSPLNSLPL